MLEGWNLVSCGVVLAQSGVVLALLAYLMFDSAEHGQAGYVLGVSVGWFSLGWLLRWLLPFHTLIHENRHGFTFSGAPPFGEGITPHGVLSSSMVLQKLFYPLYPFEGSIFLLSSLLSALAVVGMYWLVRYAWDSELAAWTAALLVACQPLALLMAPTEEFLTAATGLCLAGMALTWVGMRGGRMASLVAGLCLIGLGASVREVALPLAGLGILVMLAATEPGRPLPWRRLGIGAAILLLPLLPRTAAILQAMRQKPGAESLIQIPPVLPYTAFGDPEPNWVGWQTPYVPTWMGVGGLVALGLLAAWAILHRDWRRLIAGPGIVLAAVMQGGLVGGLAWFPSNLRHQQLAMALWMLPLAVVFAAVVTWASRSFRWVCWLGYSVPLVACAATLIAAPDGYRLDTPLTQEFRFLCDVMPGLPADAVVFFNETPGDLPDQLPEWLRRIGLRPEIFGEADVQAAAAAGPTYLLLDRGCFLNQACFNRGLEETPCSAPEVIATLGLVRTKYGRMSAACAESLGAADWREVASVELHDNSPKDPRFIHDLPSADPVVRVALLELPSPGSRNELP